MGFTIWTNLLLLRFYRRQIISIEWATTPHSFNSLLLLLLLLLLSHSQKTLVSSIRMCFLFLSWKSMYLPLDFFFVERVTERAPTEARGAQTQWSGAQIEKKYIYFSPLVRAPAGALKVYRENQCVFCGRIQYILEIDVKTMLSRQTMHIGIITHFVFFLFSLNI